MLLLFVALAVFVAWSWLSYPAVGHWLYNLAMASEAGCTNCTRSKCRSPR